MCAKSGLETPLREHAAERCAFPLSLATRQATAPLNVAARHAAWPLASRPWRVCREHAHVHVSVASMYCLCLWREHVSVAGMCQSGLLMMNTALPLDSIYGMGLATKSTLMAHFGPAGPPQLALAASLGAAFLEGSSQAQVSLFLDCLTAEFSPRVLAVGLGEGCRILRCAGAAALPADPCHHRRTIAHQRFRLGDVRAPFWGLVRTRQLWIR